MEKVYMEAPKKNTRSWRAEDVSPYDFRDDVRDSSQERRSSQENRITDNRYTQDNRNRNIQDSRIESEEDEYDMDAIMDEMNRIDDELESDCYLEADMYDNGNIDWRWNEDVSQSNMRNMTIDRKTVVEEDNPKRTTTTWMRVRRQY